MTQSILTKSAEELIILYHEINKELTTHLLDGASWDEQQNRIALLTEISKELTRRKVEIENNKEAAGQ